MNIEEIKSLWEEFEDYIRYEKKYMMSGTTPHGVKVWYDFLEWKNG